MIIATTVCLLFALALRFSNRERDGVHWSLIGALLWLVVFSNVASGATGYLVGSKYVLQDHFAPEEGPVLPYSPLVSPRLVNNGYHGVGNWPGRDWITPCGTPLYAPISGDVVAVGRDAYQGPFGANNTYLKIDGGKWFATLLHGSYIVNVGDEVTAGRTLIGYEASEGNSTSCHTHLSLRNEGRLVDPIYLDGRHRLTTLRYVEALPARITNYDPARGGINCDSDCSTTASGVPAGYNRGIVACPAAFPIGTRVEIDGEVYTCLDRGGAIDIGPEAAYGGEVMVNFDILQVEDVSYVTTNWRIVR